MVPFPLVFLTWRESILGFQPTEMVYMQVEKNWVTFNPHGEPQGNGFATGRNLGFVKWRMSETFRDGRLVRVLRSESFDRTTEESHVEEIGVDAATNALVYQNEDRSVHGLGRHAECTFLKDRVVIERTLPDGRPRIESIVPEAGMEAVQRRFAPLGKAPKDFLVLDGLSATFHRVHVELAGRYRGSWGTDRFAGKAYRFDCEGRSHTVMLSDRGEIVKVEFTNDVSLALMSQPRSRRYEDRGKSVYSGL